MQFPPDRAEHLNSFLSTERLLIEPITAAHADILFEPMQNEAIYRWISSNPPKSVDELKDWWGQRESRLSPDGTEAWLNWAIRRSSDGIYVGKLDAQVNCSDVAANIGYVFFKEFWNSGYASESVLAVVEHLLSAGISRVSATVTMGNAASYRVLEKAGLVRTRVIPDNDTIRGQKYDDVEFTRVIKT